MEQLTKLQRVDTKNRLYYTCLNVTIVLMVLSILVAFSPLAVALGFIGIAFLIFWASVFIVIFTVGLVFLEKDNIVSQMWAFLGKFDLQKSIEFQRVAAPIVLTLLGIFLLITFIGIFNKNRVDNKKGKATFIVGIILFIISLIISIASING